MLLRLTNLRSDDADGHERAARYLRDNPHPGIRARPEDLVRRAVDKGLGLLVEDDAGAIGGLSLVYPFDGDEGLYDEIGTMRITVNGLGLQKRLAQFHLFQIAVTLSPRPDVFAVVAAGTPSEHNLEAGVGMRGWTPTDELVYLRDAAGMPFDPAKRTLHADADTFAAAQSALKVAHIRDTLFAMPKDGAQLQVELGWFVPDDLDTPLDEG